MSLELRIADIEAMTAREKREEWRRLMKSSPPPAFGSGLLGRALAYHEQEKALGGLSVADRKRIERMSGSGALGKGTGNEELQVGTCLSRTWHGEVHQVLILDDGVEYRGTRYASLSAVAREITGARWSGPRFFGLHSARQSRAGGLSIG